MCVRVDDVLGGVESVFGNDRDDVTEGYFRCQRVAVANNGHIGTVPDIDCIQRAQHGHKRETR